LPELEADGALGVFSLSSVAHKGVDELLEKLWKASQTVLAEERGGSANDEEWWAP
jgi:hypothetical protein